MLHKIIQAKERIELDLLSDIDDCEIFNFIITSLKHETNTPYSALMQAILHYTVDENEARFTWESILKNRDDMETALGRKVNIKTAVVDYFTRDRINDKIIIFIKDDMMVAFDSAMRDSLTGLLSHAVIHYELEKEFQIAKRYNLPLSVMFIDIDDFKMYNDTYGHKDGDKVLIIVSEILTNSLRNTDRVGRYGGEEFLIILPHTKEKDARRIAEKLLLSVSDRSTADESFQRLVTVSIGIACMSESIKDGNDLIKNADLSMYKAKKDGKNRVSSTF